MRFKRRKKMWGESRAFDNRRNCFYCGLTFERTAARRQTIDHVFPRSGEFGFGFNDPLNTVFACHRCNNRKANMHPKDWMWQLERPEAVERFADLLVKLCIQSMIEIRAEADAVLAHLEGLTRLKGHVGILENMSILYFPYPRAE